MTPKWQWRRTGSWCKLAITHTQYDKYNTCLYGMTQCIPGTLNKIIETQYHTTDCCTKCTILPVKSKKVMYKIWKQQQGLPDN